MSNARKEKRLNDPAIQRRASRFMAAAPSMGNIATSQSGAVLAGPLQVISPGVGNPKTNGGGWGVGAKGASAATGTGPTVNPFLIPKASGLNVISQTYPSNYFVEWDISTHRIAADRVTKQGFTPDWATLVVWAYQSSPFIQSMFRTVVTAVNSLDYFFVSDTGDVLEDWTEELCRKKWHADLRAEIAKSFFWGFTGINFDPVLGRIYKYPMQDIDPINRFLRQSTYAFWDGVFFEDHDNLLFVQPSTNDEDFLGWMQAITRLFVQMNMNDTSWVAAGRKLAFPIFTIGYPETSGFKDAQGVDHNPYKDEAEMIARDIGPGSAVTFPFTRKTDGDINKNIEIQFEQTGASQKAHSVYLDFNTEKKNEIRELVLGGTLTADVGDSGSRALGEVQERKLRKFLQPVISFVVDYYNSDVWPKLQKYYKKPPKGKFAVDEAQKWTIEEIVAMADVLQSSGLEFTPTFFEKNGLESEFFQKRQETMIPPDQKAQPLSKKDDGRPQNLRSHVTGSKRNTVYR